MLSASTRTPGKNRPLLTIPAPTKVFPVRENPLAGAGSESAQEAEALYGQVLEISRRVLGPDHPTTLRTIYHLACSAALRGDRDATFGYLREAIDRGYATRRQLEKDDDLASLRHDPEFRALVARAAKNPG
jgi:hypothetical protein